MEIHFGTLWLKNFISTGNVLQKINLDANMLTLIIGMIGEADSGMKNGAGKTTILQAICYALYGKPLTRIKIPNLVNNLNKKGMFVALDFKVGDKAYRIERGQKPAFLRFFIGDKEIKQDEVENDALGENRFTQVEINRIVNMSHLMFKHIVALNTFTDPFLKEREAVQREIIEELLGITQISMRAEKLRLIMSTTKDGIKEQEAHIKATTEANSRIETTLVKLEQTERSWVRDHAATITRLQADIQALGEIDYEAALSAFDAQETYDAQAQALEASTAPVRAKKAEFERAVQSLQREQDRLTQSQAKLKPGSAASRFDREIERKRQDITRHRTKIETLKADLVTIQADQTHGDDTICVCCGQGLAGTDHLATVHAALEARRVRCDQDLQREAKAAQDLELEIATIQSEAQAVEARNAEELTDLQTRSAAIETDRAQTAILFAEQDVLLKQMVAERATLGKRPDVMFASRDELYETRSISTVLERDLENERAKTNPYLDQITAIRATLQKIDYTAMNELSTAYKHQDFLLKLLTSKDSFVRKKIVDQNLPYLNARMSHYLTSLTLPHVVVFKSDLTVEIMHLGNDYDFEQLSRGEMNRLIMATAFAFRDVWENLNTPINLLWVDELLDQGTCTPGVEAALGILQDMGMKRAKNVFLVSHKDELRGRINDGLLCHKSNEFTTFVAGAPSDF